jgi:hypothetical protein
MGAAAGNTYDEYVALSNGLQQAAWARRRFRATVVNGAVTAIVVPAARKGNVSPMAVSHH